MDRERHGGWVYIMANRYRGMMYTGVTSDLPFRISQHRGGIGSDHCARYGLNRLVWADFVESIDEAIAHEKRLKRWRRDWKFDLIDRANPEWRDLFDDLAG